MTRNFAEQQLQSSHNAKVCADIKSFTLLNYCWGWRSGYSPVDRIRALHKLFSGEICCKLDQLICGAIRTYLRKSNQLVMYHEFEIFLDKIYRASPAKMP
ncbi:uncharacterized protein ZBIST_4962 [Zygosaccharomyces bailii]|nr:uncharacterized protein ZBIST_4962 [Zygosaccharomyces bailii]